MRVVVDVGEGLSLERAPSREDTLFGLGSGNTGVEVFAVVIVVFV